MGIFDDFKNTIGETVNDLSTQGKEFSSKKRLEKEIKNIELDIEKKFHEFGKIAYERYKDNSPEEFKENISEISEQYNKIDSLKKELSDLNGKIICPECGTANLKEAKFCSSCGHKIERIEKKPSNKSFCGNCGAELKENALFCSSCGAKIELPSKPKEEVKETVTVESDEVE